MSIKIEFLLYFSFKVVPLAFLFIIYLCLLDFLTLEAFLKLGFCSRQNMQLVYVKWEKGSNRYPALRAGLNSYYELTFAVLNADIASHTLTQNQLFLRSPNQTKPKPKSLLFPLSNSHSCARHDTNFHPCSKTGFTESSSQRQRNVLSYTSLVSPWWHRLSTGLVQSLKQYLPLVLWPHWNSTRVLSARFDDSPDKLEREKKSQYIWESVGCTWVTILVHQNIWYH